MTILGNLPASPAVLGQLMTENLLLRQQLKNLPNIVKRKPA